MNPMNVALITMGTLLGSNLFGLIYSLIVMRGSFFSSYTIQDKSYRKGLFWERMPLFLFNFVILLGLSGVGAYFLFDLFSFDFDLWVILLQITLAFILDDVWFYFYHRWLHENKFMLKHVHSIHHRATKPFPLEYLYGHPAEWMLGMIGTVAAFGLFLFFSPINVFAFWIYTALRNLHEIHIHSDLSLPVLSKIPFISTTKHHDDHHSKLNGNYASTFHWLDKVFKTEFKEQ
jgi:sterol desaturase/sphingolipid hydroxylase (fatty acid hydroxylase superfamily)